MPIHGLIFWLLTLLPFAQGVLLPKVVMVGDSIRGGYQPVVERRLKGSAEVVGPGGTTSRALLEHLDEWIIARKPVVVYVNCGLHDCALDRKTNEPRVLIQEYRANLEKIFERLHRETQAHVIWATTTPVNEEWQVSVPPPRGYGALGRRNSDVRAYNAVAVEIARRFDIEVHDLYDVVTRAGRDQQLKEDGIHFTEAAYELIGQAVAETIRARLPH